MSSTHSKGGVWLAVGALLVAMFCFQTGASLAKQLFPAVGARRHGGAARGPFRR